MSESKINRNNFVALQGWMLTDLKLKGNELIIYACIYGFSQSENQVFTGSLQYLAEWTNSTKQGVIKCLKSLIDKGYIGKHENFINGVKFCEYYATKFNGVLNKVEYPIKQSLIPPIKQSLPNNIEIDNIADNIGDNILSPIPSAGGEPALPKTPTVDYNWEFETLWKMYPRKDGKKKASASYMRARKNNTATFEQVRQGIENYNQYIAVTGTPTQYIKQGSTWFGNECWNDEYDCTTGAPRSGRQQGSGQQLLDLIESGYFRELDENNDSPF